MKIKMNLRALKEYHTKVPLRVSRSALILNFN